MKYLFVVILLLAGLISNVYVILALNDLKVGIITGITISIIGIFAWSIGLFILSLIRNEPDVDDVTSTDNPLL